MADTKKNVVQSGAAEGKLYNSAEELSKTYSDNPEKPDPASVAQVQDVPEGWPGSASNG
jgi:hypothetical protein